MLLVVGLSVAHSSKESRAKPVIMACNRISTYSRVQPGKIDNEKVDSKFERIIEIFYPVIKVEDIPETDEILAEMSELKLSWSAGVVKRNWLADLWSTSFASNQEPRHKRRRILYIFRGTENMESPHSGVR